MEMATEFCPPKPKLTSRWTIALPAQQELIRATDSTCCRDLARVHGECATPPASQDTMIGLGMSLLSKYTRGHWTLGLYVLAFVSIWESLHREAPASLLCIRPKPNSYRTKVQWFCLSRCSRLHTRTLVGLFGGWGCLTLLTAPRWSVEVGWLEGSSWSPPGHACACRRLLAAQPRRSAAASRRVH